MIVHFHIEPAICDNKFDYMMANGSLYQYFVCPLADQDDSYTFCCGPTDREECCNEESYLDQLVETFKRYVWTS